MTTRYSRRTLLRAMKNAKTELKGTLTRDGYRTLDPNKYPNEYAIRKEFGNWSNAMQVFINENPEFATGTKEEVLKAYLTKAKVILGENFKRDNYRHLKDFPSENEIRSIFGSWANAVHKISI